MNHTAHELVPATGFQVGAQMEHLLGGLALPEDSRSLEPPVCVRRTGREVDNPPDGAFDGAAAEGDRVVAIEVVGHERRHRL